MPRYGAGFVDPTSEEHTHYLMTRPTVERDNEREAREMTSDRRAHRSMTSTPSSKHQATQAALVERRRRAGSLSQPLPSYLDSGRSSRKRYAESPAPTEIKTETVDMSNDDEANNSFQFDFEAPGHPSNTPKSDRTFARPSRPSTASRRDISRRDIMDNEYNPFISDFTTPKREMSIESDANALFVEETPSKKRLRNDFNEPFTPRSTTTPRPPTYSQRATGAFGTQARTQHRGPRAATFTPIRDTDETTITLGDLKILFSDLTAAQQSHTNAESTFLEVPKQFFAFKQEIVDAQDAAKQEMRAELRAQQEHMDRSFQDMAKRAEKAVKDCWECATAAHARVDLLAIATGQQKPIAGGAYGGTAMDMEEPTRFFAGLLDAQQSMQPPAP